MHEYYTVIIGGINILIGSFILVHFSTLCCEIEFLQLPVEQVCEILSDDRLNATEEQVVYEAALGWIKYNQQERLEHLAAVMKCVRFACINSYYFCDRVRF